MQGANFIQINRYDAEGYRYEVEENGIISRFAYHYGMLLAELDKDNEVTSSQYLGNEYVGGELPIKDSNVPDSINISNTKETCYYICDEQGSIRYVLNRNGEIKNYYQYSAFGESEVAEESFYTRLHYNSQIYDELTSQYYLRARYYQPQIGRFTQEDILYNDGLNLYAYCQNNPVMYSEPSGYAKTTNGCDPKVQGENAGDKSGKTTNPTFKVSRKQYPNHVKMLENAQQEGHSLTNLTRGSGTRAARKNRYESQKAIRKQQGGPPKGYDYDEFPYASTKQGGTGAYVEPVPSAENQAAGRDLGLFYREYSIKEDDLFNVEIID